MSNRPEEISSILKEQIRIYKSRIEMNEADHRSMIDEFLKGVGEN